MNIGLTYDLRTEYLAAGFSEEETAEFDRESTIEAIESALQTLGHKTERIGHLRNLVKALAGGKRWDLVFNICEGMYGLGREAQVPAVLEGFNIPCTFADSVVLALSLHKAFCKRIVRDLGVPTADFAVVTSESEVSAIELPYPLFAKPIGEGTGKGIDSSSRITNPEALRKTCARLLRTYGQPVLVETFLPGREFTVGIVGTGHHAKVVGVVEVVLRKDAEADAYSYVNKEKCEELVLYNRVDDDAAKQCAVLALKAWRGLECRDGGRLDFRLDAAGVANFLEANPLAGMNPEHSDLPIICSRVGMPYLELIRSIVISASMRITK